MEKRTKRVLSNGYPQASKVSGMKGLDFEVAVQAALATGKAPPPPKRTKKGKK